jgi:hypothetical protein
VVALLPPDADRLRPLPHWSRPIAEMLTAIYSRPLHRHDEDDAPLVRVLQLIGDVLREQAQLDGDASAALGVVVPHVTFAQAIDLTLSRLVGQAVPDESAGAAVELLGWLELQLDDAPVLIVTGFNEGAVPQSRTGDAFLPDSVRRTLGLADNRRRMARDRMGLEAIIASRPHVTLIAGRHSVQGDPLKPSRLLLLGETPTLAQRIETFYGQHASGDASHTADQAPLLLVPGGAGGFFMPPPDGDRPTLAQLRVTAFRDYIACPYRFYLKHVCKLDITEDRVFELDGRTFGTLAHEVLSAFGGSDLAHTTDAGQIADFVSHELDALVSRRFGDNPAAPVVIQREQLRARLRSFAQWQAMQADQGWRITAVETKRQATLNIDGTPFTITGTIDRIDVHEEQGHRIIDYKTSDTPTVPDKMHRKGPRDNKEWIDLQLPLYHTLVTVGEPGGAHAGASAEVGERVGTGKSATDSGNITGAMSLGYVQLPKDVQRTGFDAAPWDRNELGEAMDLAMHIIRAIRAGTFWRPANAPRFDDGLAAICMDQCLNREEAIAAATRLWQQTREARPPSAL